MPVEIVLFSLFAVFFTLIAFYIIISWYIYYVFFVSGLDSSRLNTTNASIETEILKIKAPERQARALKLFRLSQLIIKVLKVYLFCVFLFSVIIFLYFFFFLNIKQR